MYIEFIMNDCNSFNIICYSHQYFYETWSTIWLSENCVRTQTLSGGVTFVSTYMTLVSLYSHCLSLWHVQYHTKYAVIFYGSSLLNCTTMLISQYLLLHMTPISSSHHLYIKICYFSSRLCITLYESFHSKYVTHSLSV